MSDERPNGHAIPVRVPSKITKVLAHGWYDGPTDGVLECGTDGRVYRFTLLDEVRQWPTEAEDVRVFSLAPLPPTALRQLTEAYGRYFKPHWPAWVPVWSFPTAADREALERMTDQVLAQAGPAEWVIATSDLLGEPLAVRAAMPEEIAQVTDWPSYLGLTRTPAVND
jgi:hypothetical protein